MHETTPDILQVYVCVWVRSQRSTTPRCDFEWTVIQTLVLIGRCLAYSFRLCLDGAGNAAIQAKHVGIYRCMSMYSYRSTLQINTDAVYFWQAGCELFK
jgi:hypothetical protein